MTKFREKKASGSAPKRESLRREHADVSRQRRLDLLRDETDHALPAGRADCKGTARPCPMVSCRYHLYLDVLDRWGETVTWNFPSVAVEGMTESCALDVADRGGETLEEISSLMNMSRERVRQVEEKAMAKVLRRLTPEEREALLEALYEKVNKPQSYAEAEGENGGENEATSKVDGRGSRDMIGLTDREIAAADAWAEEVSGLFLEGVPLREAQALVDARETEAMPTRPDGTRVPSFRLADKRARFEDEKSKVVELLRERGPVTTAGICEALGFTVDRSWKLLGELRRAGVVVREGWRQNTVWKLRGSK